MWHELDALMHFWGYVFLLLKCGLNVSRCNYIFKSNAFYVYVYCCCSTNRPQYLVALPF